MTGLAFRLNFPLANPVITQAFGGNTTGQADFYTKWGLPAHEGLDLRAPAGTKIFACAPGIISRIERQTFVGDGSAYGIQVRINHTDAEGQEYETIYAHLKSVEAGLVVGGKVKLGQLIGRADHSGNTVAGQDHLHLSVKKRGATERGEQQKLIDGTPVVYPKDLVDPTSLFGAADVIDVSGAGQGVIDWDQVIQWRVKNAYMRATQGISEVDTQHARNAAETARFERFGRGFYHAFIASQDGIAQARHFMTAIGHNWNMTPAVDVELQNGQTPEIIADRLYDMLREIEAQIGYKPMIYTSVGFFDSYVGGAHDDYFRQCPLWVANFDADRPALPRCWNSYYLWQFSSSGYLPGIAGRVDLNRF